MAPGARDDAASCRWIACPAGGDTA
jgi:hypothetical protein